MNDKPRDVNAERLETTEKYVAPEMERHEPVKVVQGSGGDCSLYYTSLYYTYYY